MSLPVHLVPTLAGVVPQGRVEVTGDEAHHAVAVRRLRVGEPVLLTDGAGTTVRGDVAETGKRSFSVTVREVDLSRAPEPSLVVVQALPKGERGELAVSVLTEIGAATIVPWAAARSVAVWRGERAAKSHARWEATAREAAKQARRHWFPSVAPLATTGEAAARIARADLAVVLHEDAEASLSTLEVPPTGEIALVIGPEGGLTSDELAAFEAAGASTVRLGAEVLRTSTAGVAACAALLARTARWA
ncbi:16S rRNA (uracil(1498)-N(3))-methyltransferase [Nocardioides donggukensis]|uniref:Ribosomal RNA small subunit methyltransferase E n=1 Tax=Nocardioides donggukensis TaxID=2774019 RepID=A0A927K6G3_9ACTN|nr:16S rRNA (uracil(1498)-N(3))-methyltransferase [Nocardioides donggukensis]MBD8870020.1 16S rRNA (uracil(1498)-N(3))-methyltransferase [Nocardioides donggukensis]